MFALNFSTEEQLTGGTWINKKPIYRKTIDFGQLPNTTTKHVPHNIVDLEFYVGVIGFATNIDTFSPYAAPLPLVYRSAEDAYNATLECDATTVFIATDRDRSNKRGYVTVYYTKKAS